MGPLELMIPLESWSECQDTKFSNLKATPLFRLRGLSREQINGKSCFFLPPPHRVGRDDPPIGDS